jgi:four helix bundle protein
MSAEPGVVRQIAWQLADAGTSVAANYEEAKGSYSKREFTAKNCIVLKEAREARLWLRIVLTCGLAPEIPTRALYDEANELVAIFTSGMRTLRGPWNSAKRILLVVVLALLIAFRVFGFEF